MSRFPTAGELCSWGTVCPGQDESAGKRRSGRTRKGNRYLKTALIEAALGATRTKGTALQARYFRVKRHRGHQKAVLAVAHQILEIAYFIMRDGVMYPSSAPRILIDATGNEPNSDVSANCKPSATTSRSLTPRSRRNAPIF